MAIFDQQEWADTVIALKHVGFGTMGRSVGAGGVPSVLMWPGDGDLEALCLLGLCLNISGGWGGLPRPRHLCAPPHPATNTLPVEGKGPVRAAPWLHSDQLGAGPAPARQTSGLQCSLPLCPACLTGPLY